MLPDFAFVLTVEGTVSASEEPGKVREAAANVILGSSYDAREDGSSVILRTQDPRALSKLHDQFRDRRVRGAARRLLLRGTEGESTTLMINRQAAAAGVIVLCSSEIESPLGPLVLKIQSKQLDPIVKWLTDYVEG